MDSCSSDNFFAFTVPLHRMKELPRLPAEGVFCPQTPAGSRWSPAEPLWKGPAASRRPLQGDLAFSDRAHDESLKEHLLGSWSLGPSTCRNQPLSPHRVPTLQQSVLSHISFPQHLGRAARQAFTSRKSRFCSRYCSFGKEEKDGGGWVRSRISLCVTTLASKSLQRQLLMWTI